MIWAAVLLGSLGTYLEKAIGYLLPPRILDRPRISRIAMLLPIALLAALVAVQTLADASTLAIDARVIGLGVAIVALLLRAPFLVVVVSAACAAAVVRALGIAP